MPVGPTARGSWPRAAARARRARRRRGRRRWPRRDAAWAGDGSGSGWRSRSAGNAASNWRCKAGHECRSDAEADMGDLPVWADRPPRGRSGMEPSPRGRTWRAGPIHHAGRSAGPNPQGDDGVAWPGRCPSPPARPWAAPGLTPGRPLVGDTKGRLRAKSYTAARGLPNSSDLSVYGPCATAIGSVVRPSEAASAATAPRESGETEGLPQIMVNALVRVPQI